MNKGAVKSAFLSYILTVGVILYWHIPKINTRLELFMKIKRVVKDFDEVMAIEPPKHFNPKMPNIFWQTLTKVVSLPALIQNHFTHREVGMEKLGKNEPALFLMNHVGFTDFEVAYSMLYPRKFNTVGAFETFMGLEFLMKQIGCFPSRKYISDLQVIRDIKYCIKENKTSVLMYPEAAYSFDGTKTVLPAQLAGFVKMLGVPLCVIQTYGVYLHQPIYNYVQKRKVPISAEMRYVLSPEEIAEKTVEEIEEIINREFGYDDFRWQQENNIVIDEPTRADGLASLLYKCPHCMAEGKMEGKGTHLTCHACGKQWELTETGFMQATEGETEINHIPDWYQWERECVRKEIEEGTYGFDIPCDIMMIVDTKALYSVGEGRITHDMSGFHLTGCDGRLDYHQSARSIYTCESAFHWYEIGDVIGIGNHRALYFAMPKEGHRGIVCKARLATEEIFKIIEKERKERLAEKRAHREAAATE